MNARDATRLQSFRRAVQCIDRHPELHAVAAPGSAWKKLNDAIAHVAALQVRQSYAASHGKELTTAETRLHEAARALINQMSLIAELEGIGSPGRRVFPNPNQNASTADVIVAARTCAELAPAHMATFMGMGLSPTCITDLQDAADALEAAVADRVDAAGSRHGATKGIPDIVARGALQLGILDSVLRPHMNAEALAEWEQATKLGRTHRPARPKKAPDMPSAAPGAMLALTSGEAPATPEVVAHPEPAPLKALPPANILEALIARLIRREAPVERQSVEQNDVTVEEIKRLPPPRS